MDKPIRVLLIEDNPGDAGLIREMLAGAREVKPEVVYFVRLSEGLERLLRGDIDVVLLDLGLPDSQGTETLLSVRRQSPEVPVVILTGLADEEFALKAITMGADDYLIKGRIDSDLLMRAIRYTIERKRTLEALRRERDRARRYLDIAGVMIVALNRDQKVTLINQKGCDILGYREDEIIGENWVDHFIPAEGKEKVREVFNKIICGGISPVEYYENPVLTRDGNLRIIAWHNSFIGGESGEIVETLSSGEDITERKKAEETLRESEERYRIITEAAQDAIITIIDEESRIMFANPAAEKIFGYTSAELHGKPLTMLMPERLRQAHRNGVKRHLAAGKRHLPWGAVEMPGLHRDGREIPLEITYGEFIKNGKYFFIGFVRDITERKKAEETIKYQAYHDLLTGLPNRAQLMLRFEIELAQAKRNRKKLAVLHIDLDRFKVINDSLGHTIGDKVILAVAERLRTLIRKSDTLARIGSDEFIILLADINRAEDAALFAHKAVEAMRTAFQTDHHQLYATASIGISMCPEDSDHAEVLLRNADIAVSHVKERGRNNYQFFNPDINVRTVERLLLESNLRQSLERSELVLYYQPQVNIRTGEIMCIEALVRWKHPELGILLPAQFIPVAEEIGFIPAIDEWVLRTACVQNKAWQDAGYPSLCVTVNLSAQQFQQPTFIEMVSGIIHEVGLDPQCLDIEVTEGTAMRDINIAIPNLRGLNELGIRLSIDDFGTGYSSLNYLKRFPVHTLKIDQSFIRGVATDPDDQEIVRAVVAIAHNMKMKVIAEGVETDEQLAFLRTADCDEMQGFLFSEPLPPERIERLLSPHA